MSVGFWKQIAATLRRLSPRQIQRDAVRPFSLALVATGEEIRHWMPVLVPPGDGERKREQALKRLFTIPLPVSRAYAEMLPRFDLVLATPAGAAELRAHQRDYVLLPTVADGEGAWAESVMEEVAGARPEISVPLARHYWPLRDAVVDRIIRTVARENAAFAILSALPNVIPSPIELPWAIGEFASDTAIITTNQFRMAFLIAAASDAPVGWGDQKGQIASIAGSAFGLRAIARELAGKLPAGGGLVAKGLIAFAATYAMGRGLDQFHRAGRHFTRGEKSAAYRQAFRDGRRLVEEMARKLAGRSREAVRQIPSEPRTSAGGG